MKRISFRWAVLMTVMMMSTTAFAQMHLDGKVVDEQGNPMPFVNVVLITMPDSAYVQGTVTDEQGLFDLYTSKRGDLLKVSSIGYETQFLSPVSQMIVTMKENTVMLGEVVVKSSLPKTRVKGNAMRTTIEGTILEKAGTVTDALKRVPSLETDRDGAVKVLGRGDAEIYINGRRVQDVKELSRLRSDQIQHVDVVQNPGARYAASTKAVVLIQLKKAQGEGFGFQDNVLGMYMYGYTLTNNLDVNYRTGGLDLTVSFWAGRFGHSKSLQENDMLYYVGPDHYRGHSKQDSKMAWKGWSPQLQVNYMVNENHSFGAFYKFDRHPGENYLGKFNTDNYVNGVFTERSESDIWMDESFSKHIFNAYYNGKVGNLGIDVNVDGLFGDTDSPSSTTELTKPAEGDVVTRSIESDTKNGNDFWATKLILSYPVWKGNLSVGGEYSHNHRTDAYTFTASEAVPVKATDTEINESSTSAFVEFGRSFGKVFTQVGLRYEHLSNDYFDFGKRQDEVCRNYGDWFPTAVISVPVGKVQLSLSYRRDIQRPNYSNLTSSTTYLNRYSYQSGNPYLKPTYTHSLMLNGAYKWMNLSLNYARIKDAVTMSTEPFPGSDDPLVSLVRPINSDEDYNRLTVVYSMRPVVGCWHPIWNVYGVFQNYKSLKADGSSVTLNHPYFSLAWQNDIELPHGFRLNVGLLWNSKGDFGNYRITRSQFAANVGLQRDINLHRLGSLTVDLRCIDIFNSNKTGITIYGIRELTSSNPARRTFSIDLTWKFNKAQSKYRGSGAGDQQKARM
ncbi:MAG: TonB-dependent receptor [Muribaculaceae bacterium]|nr:TonB-dependent receptor [Muribaculaceae bacterium]